MPTFDTYADLQRNTNLMIKTALNNTIDRIFDKLQDFISKEVYSNNQTWYARTWEVRDKWDKIKAEIKGNFIEGEIYFTDNISHSGSPLWQHGMSEIDGDTLLKVLIGDYNTGNVANFNNPNPRDFWNPFIKWVDQNFDSIFKEELNKL